MLAASSILLAAFVSNAVGIRVSSRIQLVLMVLLVGLLALAVALAAPHAKGVESRTVRPRTASAYGIIAAVMVAVLLFSSWALVVPAALAGAAVWAGQRFAGNPPPARKGLPARR